MLSGSFFDIQSFNPDEQEHVQQKINAVVSLNPSHPLFEGHFPGNPVVPGVCQVQMVKELVEKALDRPLILRESDNIKFLAMINPLMNPVLNITLVISPVVGNRFAATATIGHGPSLFLKFKGTFEPSA